MKKFLLCAVMLACMLAAPVSASGGVTVYVGGSVLDDAVIRDGTAYVPIRAFTQLIAPTAAVEWDSGSHTAKVHSDGLELTAVMGKSYIVANGRYLWLGEESFISDGRLMLPVRPLAKAYGCEPVWNAAERSVRVSGPCSPIESGDSFYNGNDLYWLARIIYAEAGGECLEGQIAVGNVVLNRMSDDYWPDSVYDVVFDRRCGVQFSPTSSGTVYNEPSESSVIAAKLAMDGASVAGDSTFFLNEAIATSFWIVDNCQYVTTIGGHSFYM